MAPSQSDTEPRAPLSSFPRRRESRRSMQNTWYTEYSGKVLDSRLRGNDERRIGLCEISTPLPARCCRSQGEGLAIAQPFRDSLWAPRRPRRHARSAFVGKHRRRRSTAWKRRDHAGWKPALPGNLRASRACRRGRRRSQEAFTNSFAGMTAGSRNERPRGPRGDEAWRTAKKTSAPKSRRLTSRPFRC